MRPFLLIAFLSFTAITADAQQVINVDKDEYNAGNFYTTINGEPVVSAKFIRLAEGTPFYVDQWQKSTITTPQGKVIKDIPIKLDLMDGKLHYLDAKGKEYIASTHVTEVVLNDSVNNKDFRFLSSFGLPLLKEGWYVPLVQGTASLYKIFDKTLRENKPYGSALTEQRIVTKEKYVVVYNNQAFYLKNDKEVLSALADKKGKVETFMKGQHKKQSLQEKLVETVTYYNTVVAKPS
jgi:hypothetical protein